MRFTYLIGISRCDTGRMGSVIHQRRRSRSDSCRELFGNPTGIQPDYWPLHNAELYTLLSCTVLIAIFATLSVRRYTRATSR